MKKESDVTMLRCLIKKTEENTQKGYWRGRFIRLKCVVLY